MENPEQLLKRIVDFAAARDGVHAVVQTGSRARGRRVDAYSDLDIELIGPGTAELVGEDAWLEEIAPVLVAIHLDNEAEDEPDWPTCLAVFAEGRKADFTLAGPERLERMAAGGLDELYRRGYLVHLDETGAAGALEPSDPRPPDRSAPDAEEFETDQREFWFEATQIPVHIARQDLWPAASRLVETGELLLRMLEWNAFARSGGAVDTWYGGHRIAEWAPEPYRSEIPSAFAGYDPADQLRALRSITGLYSRIAAETGALLRLPVLDLHDRVAQHIDRVIAAAADR
ncbi:aminoglycoside 6-adenylyltransferase [Nocardiopsis potens]|uniref:aminoglycoside 6-adenylyltransferase n=1 Tax=Nocardiopsis potens TaxID=1246458 RepID=UPI00034825C5|nr:aminoglycoside 6-adenylyltransferase [Nocardiopsis potens]